MRYFEKIVNQAEDGLMLKDLLRPLGAGRRLRRRMLAEQTIRRNDRPAFLTERVQAGDVVTVDAPDDEPSECEPERLPFGVTYEDEHMLVVDKPPAMLVHPTAGERTGTLANAVLYHWRTQGETCRFRPLHRLDRGTSGLLIIAKHKLALERLERDLKRRRIVRQYVAFVEGGIEQEALTVTAPIGLLPGQTVQRGVVADGRHAVTHMSVLARFANSRVSQLLVRLETGRTHQIRVHAAYIGHPVLGDAMYGHGAVYGLKRQALHATSLAFDHPFTGEPMTVHAPLPADLTDLENGLT